MIKPLSRTSSKMKLCRHTSHVTLQANRVEPHSNAFRIFAFLLSLCNSISLTFFYIVLFVLSPAQLPG